LRPYAHKLCHDLISPVGAIANGVELLQDIGGGDAEITQLLAHAAGEASRRLAYFRMAFGIGGDPVSRRTAVELRDLAADWLESGRLGIFLARHRVSARFWPAGGQAGAEHDRCRGRYDAVWRDAGGAGRKGRAGRFQLQTAREQISDPSLEALLDDIDLRAQVELAKHDIQS